MSTPPPAKTPVNDDLDDLDDLDDYLDEFQDEVLSRPYDEVTRESATATVSTTTTSTTASAAKEKPEEKTTPASSTTTTTAAAAAAAAASSEPTEEQVLEQFKSLMGQQSPDLQKQFEQMVSDMSALGVDGPSTSNATPQPPSKPENLKDTISSTLNRLKESNAKIDQTLKDEQLPSQDLLTDLLSQLNGADGEGDIGALLTEMLNSLASKEVLYEPLKDLNTKYPLWLKENAEKTSKADMERYTKQAAIVSAIVEEFDKPDYSDDNDEQRAFISQKLEEMQESGDPPKDLMGDAEKAGIPGFGFGGDDDASLPEGIDKDMEKELEQQCQQQ